MTYEFDDIEIDQTRFELSIDGEPVAVQPQVLELLIFLIANRNQLVTKDHLLETIWKGRVVSETALTSRIKAARRAIGDDGVRQRYIKTIHGRGYRFVGNLANAAEESRAAGAAGSFATTVKRPATQYAKSGSAHIAYHLFGEGPVNLVITPGFVSHIDNYWDSPHVAAWLTRLGSVARVAIFDKRGTGMSDRVIDLPGMDERMDDVRAVMDAVNFETATIAGISEGGSLAALFAAHNPERCEGLVLCGSFPKFSHWFPDDASLQELFDYIESDWGSGKSLPRFAPSMADDKDFIEWWGKFERLGATPGAAIALMQMNNEIDISDILSSINVPTLVLHNTEDVLIGIEGGRELARNINGAKLVELPGSDHLPWVPGNSEAICAEIERFLADKTKPQAIGTLLATVSVFSGDFSVGDKSIIDDKLQLFRADRTCSCPPGICATFSGPARALECAVAVSQILESRGVSHRIGIHTGQVDNSAGDIAGIAADVASDVCQHAHDSEILVSRTVNDLVAGSGLTLVESGEFLLPALAAEWQLFRVA